MGSLQSGPPTLILFSLRILSNSISGFFGLPPFASVGVHSRFSRSRTRWSVALLPDPPPHVGGYR
jgi:hypothetical protein